MIRKLSATVHDFLEQSCTVAESLRKIHLHETRHTFARMVAKRSGSLSKTQDALGHRHASTTRIYVESIADKTDKYTQHILEALELPDFEIDSSSDSGAD
jgi:integrase